MAKEATTKKTAADKPEEELVELVITSEKVIKIGNMKCGKGTKVPAIEISRAEKLVADGLAVRVY